jgi:IS5 family transposase
MEGEVAARFFDAVVAQASEAALLSDEHFTVDGTQLEAWASLKSFVRRDAPPAGPPDDPGNPTVDFRGEKRSNATHASTTDPDAQLYKKADGQKSVLSYLGHLLMENRHGLIVNACVTEASGTAEREAALLLLQSHRHCTLGADKSYDVASFVAALRAKHVTPHVTQKRQYSALDQRTTRHAGYAISQRKRKLVEQAFGWMKTVGLLRKLRHRGGARVDWVFTFTAAVYNMVRLRTLVPVGS